MWNCRNVRRGKLNGEMIMWYCGSGAGFLSPFPPFLIVISTFHFHLPSLPQFHIYHIVKIPCIPLKNILEFRKKLLLCIVNNSSHPIFHEMKKNSPISILTGVVLHAFNKRGFFVTPACVIFSVRPIPFWVRRWYSPSIVFRQDLCP